MEEAATKKLEEEIKELKEQLSSTQKEVKQGTRRGGEGGDNNGERGDGGGRGGRKGDSELWRELERSERQRSQLSDHIEVLFILGSNQRCRK